MEEFRQLYYATDGFCEYSGRAFDLTKGGAPSCDRIDNSKGYAEGNVAWVRWDCNRGKGEMSRAEYVELCRDVVRFSDVGA